jgi:ATP-binding cassette subfamily A (ABC1) protein 3
LKHIDEDVLKEEERVLSANPKDMQVRVAKFRKVFKTGLFSNTVAVHNASFGLEFGDCFALLGVNGAGKTTTFRSLTNEEVPTSGTISVGGFNILT